MWQVSKWSIDFVECDIRVERIAQSCVIMRVGTKYYKQYPTQRLQLLRLSIMIFYVIAMVDLNIPHKILIKEPKNST